MPGWQGAAGQGDLRHPWGHSLEEGGHGSGAAVTEACCLCLSGIRRHGVPAGHAEVPRVGHGPGVSARPPQGAGRDRHDPR